MHDAEFLTPKNQEPHMNADRKDVVKKTGANIGQTVKVAVEL